jgi:3-oxoadipate enol-lactonase
MPTFRSSDLDVYYEVSGHGPRLVLCNGSGGSIDAARLLIDFLARTFTVAVHDQRGLGKTGLPASPAPATMSSYANDVAALLDHLAWPTTLMAGMSFGGMVALEFAVTYPERLERLALLCTSSGGAGGSSYPLHDLVDLSVEERMALAPRLSDTRFDDQWLAEHPTDAAIVTEGRKRIASEREPEERRGELWQLDARRHHDVWDRLGAITCPTFIGAGRYDGTAPLTNAEAIASRIATSELHVYDGGHIFLVQDRAALPDVVSFLTDAAT